MNFLQYGVLLVDYVTSMLARALDACWVLLGEGPSMMSLFHKRSPGGNSLVKRAVHGNEINKMDIRDPMNTDI